MKKINKEYKEIIINTLISSITFTILFFIICVIYNEAMLLILTTIGKMSNSDIFKLFLWMFPLVLIFSGILSVGKYVIFNSKTSKK